MIEKFNFDNISMFKVKYLFINFIKFLEQILILEN